MGGGGKRNSEVLVILYVVFVANELNSDTYFLPAFSHLTTIEKLKIIRILKTSNLSH